jgi:hypothetical protein
MKTKFENRYEISINFLREFYWGLLFKKRLAMYMYIASIAIILIDAYLYIDEGKLSVGSFEALIIICGITLIYTCAMLLMANSVAKTNFRSMQDKIKGQKCFSDIKVNDRYEISDSVTGKTVFFNHTPISNMKVTKNLIILQLTKDKWLTFRKDSFKVGSYENFKAFLKTTYPGYKIR